MNQSRLSDSLLKAATKNIRKAGDPLRIILFGSHAREDATPDSDYDFLIIEESSERRYKRAAKYRRVLKEMRFAKDIVVWTPEEVKAWQNVPNAFITTALREGIVLYEK